MSTLSDRPDNSTFLRQDYSDMLYKQASGIFSIDTIDRALADMGQVGLLDMVPSTPVLDASVQSNTASLVQDTITNNLVGANLVTTYINKDIVALTSGMAVYISGANNIARADKDIANAATKTVGLVYQPSIAVNVAGSVIQAGLFVGALTGATANTLYYLGNAGAITSTLPTSGQIVVVGWAKNATDLFVKITTLAALSAVTSSINFQFGTSNYLWYAYPFGISTDPLPWYQVAMNIAMEDDGGFQGGVNS